MIHYLMTQDEQRRKYGSTGNYEPAALCGNGSYHAEKTRDVHAVDCPQCVGRLRTGAGYLDRHEKPRKFAAVRRVNTPHGPGTVTGFEAFDDKGRNVEPSTTDNGRRVIVQLDDPAAWPAHTAATTPPHYFRDEVTPI